MSLQVEGHRRGRSRSPGGRERDRSRSRGPSLVVDVDPGYDDRDRDYHYDYDDRRQPLSYRSPTSLEDDYYRRPRSPAVENGARISHGDLRERHSDSSDGGRDGGGGGGSATTTTTTRVKKTTGTGLGLADAFLPQKYARKLETSDAYNLMTAPLSERSRERSRDRRAEKKEKLEADLAYGKLPAPRPLSPRPVSSSSPSPPSPEYEYASGAAAPLQEQKQRQQHHHHQNHHEHEHERHERHSHRDSHSAEPRRSGADLLSVGGGGGSGHSSGRGRSRSRSPAARDRSADGRKHHAHRDSLTAAEADAPRKSALKRSSSPQPPPPLSRMSSLSVNTAYNAGSLAAAPPSPLLESYHGTYQSMSPMPSPLLLPTASPTIAIETVSPLNSDYDDEGGGSGTKRRHRRARFADPEDDAQTLAEALRGSGPPRTEPLVEILPGLTHEQVMDLRAQYKRLVKTGPEKKGVNVAKHIRVRLKDEDPSLMKACYATALGRWESEAYWSSFWYQGDKTRRELLIESLMGRTNDEIREIRDAFSDKTYDNSLLRCMKHELKEDKFKKAVLLVLEKRRMDDVDAYGRPLEIDHDLVDDDVRELRSAVKADKGGESAMINIVVRRSDNHLREVLRVYSEKHRSNFARDALRKSGNLVGELLAHILNGVINKPVRDALLVHHALTASKRDALRRELLTSRLVRYHWDGAHMIAVKRAYQERYGKDMMEAVADGTSGEWGQFCRELCITRMPDTVAKFHVSRGGY